ncbi:MAG: DUF3857 domain-containing protein [Myxococcales bacterium]|nr:DUF3857 domain-containing protein [Myxococcales bacterium]
MAFSLVLSAPSSELWAADSGPTSGRQTLWTPGVVDPKAGLPGRWVRELERRGRVLNAGPARNPARVLGLLGMLVELQGELSNDTLTEVLTRVHKSSSQDPLVRSFAGYQLARVAEADGRRDEAIQRYRDEGYLLDWQILGPFDNSSRGGHGRAYGPETTEYAADQSFDGKLSGEPLSWRVFGPDQALQSAFVPLDELVDPRVQATAYLTTWVRAPKAGTMVLHLGTSGAHKVWVNGTLAGEGDVYRVPHPLQEAYNLPVQAGWNRILIKLSVDDGLWGMFARISRADGAPTPGLEVTATPEAAPAVLQLQAPGAEVTPADPGAREPKPPRSIRGLLEQRFASAKARADDKLALVEFNHWVHPFGEGDRAAVERARAADEAAKSGRSAFFLARTDPDQNTSREALQAGIQRARAEGAKSKPLLATMLVDLGYRYHALGLDRRGRELLREAFTLSPDDAEIELALVDQLAEDGFTLSALSWVEDMRQRYPDSGMILREHATRLMELGRTRAGIEEFTALQRRRLTDRYIVDNIIEGLLRLGEADEAVALARRRVEAAPGLAESYRDLAQLEEARGQVDAARAALLRAIELAPLDDELHAEFGRFLARAGETREAVIRLRRSLELKPQQPDIRDLIATLDTRAKSDLLARYDVDLERQATAPTPASWAGKDAGVLHERIVVRVLQNGLTERLEHRIIRVLDDRGIRSQMVHGIAYDPAESYVDIRRARVRRADGTVEELGDPSAVSLTEAGYRMYYDQRLQRVLFRGLRVGDTIEVAFIRRDVAARNKFDDYFGELIPRDDMIPTRFSEYVLEAPASRKLYFNKPVKRTLSKDEKTAIYRHVVKDREGIRPEPSMPGWTEIAEYLHVSTFADWDAVGRWYWDLVKEQLAVDDKIRAGVQEAMSTVGKGASELDKVGAIYRHVIEKTRYVGLEFGIHGYKPYRTTDIYDRKFGDCKDKASLLKVMLAEIGVDAHLVLVRTSDQGPIGKTPASLSAFNHAIVYVPALDLYLDGTAEHSGPRELPAGDQGASVLIVKDGQGAEQRTIPISGAGDNVQDTTQRITIAEDGTARVRHDLTMTGVNAASWRATLQPEETRKERLTNAWGRYFPGLEVTQVKTPGIQDVLRPVQVDAEFNVPGFAQQADGAARFHVFGYRTQLVRAFAPQARREHDIELSTPATEIHRIEYELPRGYTFSRVPKGADFEIPEASFHLEIRESGAGKALVESRLVYRKHRITAGDYRAFREFLRQVDETLAQSFEIRPGR